MTVLVGVSPAARDDAGGAVTLAVRLAAARDEELAIAVVVPPGSGDSRDSGDEVTGARAAVEPELARGARTARWRIVEGRSPAEALLEAAGDGGERRRRTVTSGPAAARGTTLTRVRVARLGPWSRTIPSSTVGPW